MALAWALLKVSYATVGDFSYGGFLHSLLHCKYGAYAEVQAGSVCAAALFVPLPLVPCRATHTHPLCGVAPSPARSCVCVAATADAWRPTCCVVGTAVQVAGRPASQGPPVRRPAVHALVAGRRGVAEGGGGSGLHCPACPHATCPCAARQQPALNPGVQSEGGDRGFSLPQAPL